MWISKKRKTSRRRRKSLLRSSKAIRGFARGLILEILGAALIIFLFMMIRIRPHEQQKRMDAREQNQSENNPERVVTEDASRPLFR